MKKNCLKLISVILTAALTCCLGVVLFACNPQPTADKRKEASQEVASAILSSTDSTWKIDLSNDKISKLALPGDYVMASARTGFLSDILYKSTLQTAKISRIAEGLRSDEGKQILDDINNADSETAEAGFDAYFRLFESFGLTAVDVSNLFDVAMKAIINDTAKIVGAAREKLLVIGETEAVKNGEESVRENVNNAIISAGGILQSLNGNLTAENKKTLTDALNAAHGATDAIISSAYQLSFSSNLGGIIDQISSGAFDQVSEEEIRIYINSFTESFKNIKASLTANEISKLNLALSLISENLGNVVLPSNILNRLIAYVRTLYLAADYIPDLCDLVIAAADSAVNDETFFSMLKSYAADQSKPEEERLLFAHNSGIFAAKLLSGALEDMTPEKIDVLITRLGESAGNVYEKNVPFFALYTVIFTLTADDGIIDPDAEKNFAEIADVYFSDAAFSSFRAEYAMYKSREGSGNPYSPKKLKAAANKLIGPFDIYIPSSVKEFSSEWYDLIATPVAGKLAAETERLKPTVMSGLSGLFAEFFDKVIPSVEKLASMQLIRIDDVVNGEKLEELYNNLYFGLIFGE